MTRPRSLLRVLPLAAVFLLFTTLSDLALAQVTIENPGRHPRYHVELDPHFSLGASNPPGPGWGWGVGPGFRASINIVDRGFIKTINDSFALGFGIDWLFYNDGSRYGRCGRWRRVNGVDVCTDATYGNSRYFYFPFVAQWNFWFTERFSGFAEPGLNLYWRSDDSEHGDFGVSPNFAFGGRVLITQSFAATFRIGYPVFTAGLSWLL